MHLLPLGAVFEFHREHRAIRMELHQIGLADEPQPVGPEGQGAFHFHPRLHLVAGRVHQVVHGLPTRGVDVVHESLLQVDQPALARAVGPVLEGGEGDGVGFVHRDRHPDRHPDRHRAKMP